MAINVELQSYNAEHRVPNWVCERINKDTLTQNATRKPCKFFEDKTIDELFRSRLSDYRNSGFDRGHLAAAGNHSYDQDAVCSTFNLASMGPQVSKGFNSGAWLRLEEYTRSLASTYKNVYVCSGPLYIPHKRDDGTEWIRCANQLTFSLIFCFVVIVVGS
eukprot:m.184564 g.184564  ORF g.184564 m.184564 type:complete len:161 (+) comp15560_c0_seq25:380-862(+)